MPSIFRRTSGRGGARPLWQWLTVGELSVHDVITFVEPMCPDGFDSYKAYREHVAAQQAAERASTKRPNAPPDASEDEERVIVL